MATGEKEKLLSEWLSVIGAITLFWSPVERSIDQLSHLLYEDQEESERKKKPMTLRFKLDYIRKYISAEIIPEKDLEELIDLTKKTVQIRDVCVHGMLQEFDDKSMRIGKVQGASEEHMIEVFTIDRQRLDESASSMQLLTQHWGRLVHSMVSARESS